MKEYRQMNSTIIIIFSLFLQSVYSACTRERCCLISTCTTLYCQQQSSQTWISTQTYDKYQYTKLVMVDNQCKPCAYNCKQCISQTSCSECYDSFYLSASSCKACPYKCQKCQQINSLQKCSLCEDGAYLDQQSKTCKLCPLGAKICVDTTNIVQCNAGYLKSSNSLFCTPCSSNCVSCPNSNNVCTVCSTGYYVSAGVCRTCTIVGCGVCQAVGAAVYCSTCLEGYFRSSSTVCSNCPLNCRVCSSSTTCTTCKTNYFIQGGGCSLVPTLIPNCTTYSNTTTNSINKCTVCTSGYYLSNNSLQCIPCSITCNSCYGDHFGRCTSCGTGAKLFNQMCLPYGYLDSRRMQIYYTATNDADVAITGGVLACNKLLYSGSTISIKLNSLSAYKIGLSYRLFTSLPTQQYNLTTTGITNSTTPLSSSNLSTSSSSQQLSASSLSYSICSSPSTLYAHITSMNISSIKINNTLTFSSSFGGLYLAQLLVIAYKCADLCLECSQSQCFQCLNQNLYRQDAYCVYVCGTGYYTYELAKQCVKECPLGTYGLLTNISCMPCVSPCVTCLNDKYCLSCQPSYFLSLQDHTCQTACPYRYYGSLKTQKCQQCVGRCLQCIDDEQCLTCQVGFLENTTCVDNCQDGYYQNISTLKCQLCSPLCLTCGYSSTFCLSCNVSQGLYWYQNTCVANCPDGYFQSLFTARCQTCNYPCQTCFGVSTFCLSCVDGYLLNNICYSACPDLYYEDNVRLVCLRCSIQCTKCVASSTYCLQCIPGYKLHNNKCLSPCPSTYYPQTISQSQTICSKCTGLCYTCTNPTYCTSCVSNFLASNGSGICVQSSYCLFGQYADIDHLMCLTCSSNCMACIYNRDFCVVCFPGQVLYQGVCLSQCPSLYFYNSTTLLTNPSTNSSTCTVCQQPCKTCLNQVQCLSCIQGYKYSPNTHICSSTCSIGSFFNTSLSDCQQCSNSCLTCQSSTFCYICSSSTYLYVLSSTSNQCVSNCPDLYYADGLTCMKCLYPCALCRTSIDCVSCVNGVLYQARCIAGCPDSTFMVGYLGIGNVCVDCGGLCVTCKVSATNCTSCITGYYLISALYQCVITCPDGTYPLQITKSCLSCPETCSKCTNSSYCTACISGKTYLNSALHNCVEYCPTGTYGNSLSNICQPCASKCQTCSTTSTQCLTCSPGYLLTRLPSSTFDCVTSCPSLYYADSSICYQCQFPCKQCRSASQCLTCAVGTFFHQQSQSCILSCPLGTYYELTPTLKCKTCVPPCQSCKSTTSCISCISGYLLYQGTCVSQCPQLYYADGSGICNRCYGVCKTCSGKYQCLTCQTGYAYSGYCYSACPPGTYASEQTKKCQPCQSPCLQCTNTALYCKRCQYNLYAYRGQCSSACPIGTYQNRQVCISCQFPCVKCSNQFTCQQCIGGYLLYMRTSCIQNNQQKCPNDLYKLDSKECVPSTWCPAEYYRDQTLKTCSLSCSRQKYVKQAGKACLDNCGADQWVGQSMRCHKWADQLPISLMVMETIVFIKCSEIHIVVIFNETYEWLQKSEELYTVVSLQSSRRLLSTTSSINYTLFSSQELILQIRDMPYSASLTLPAHYLRSTKTNYNPQTYQITTKLPRFIPYTYEQVYIGSIMKQFSEGISWFIILFSMFFLFMNRLSDAYVLWDTAQLLYLLVFLDLQYPPNLNDFLVGLSNINLLFVPSLFESAVGKTRLKSSSPFYAYSYDSSFLRTAGSPLLLVLIVLLIFIVLKAIELLTRCSEKVKQKLDQSPKIKTFIFNGLLRFRWHHTSDIFFLSYDIIALFSIVEICNISKNPNNIPSNVICVLILLIYLAFPCFVSLKLYRHFGNISKGKMVANLQCFYRGIEKTNKFGISLILLRYFRKITYAIIIGVFTEQPMFALPILTFTSVLLGLFIFINKPFKKKLSNIINVGVEVGLVIVYILIAVCQFGQEDFNISGKMIIGWVACGCLLFMLFALIFQIFCKTMFYLEPEGKNSEQKGGQHNELTKKFSEQYIRQKAGEFFDHIFPRLKLNLNLDDSEEYLNEYEQGDSENSENNEQRQKNWGIDSQQASSKHSDQFRHYGGNSQDSESKGTGLAQNKAKKAPNYLIRCVKQLN